MGPGSPCYCVAPLGVMRSDREVAHLVNAPHTVSARARPGLYRGGALFHVPLQMNAYATGLDNPKFTFNWTRRGERKKFTQSALQTCERGRCAEFKDHDARALLRWKTRHLTEIAIQRDQRAAFRNARVKDSFVGRAGQSLLRDRHHVMSGLP